MVTKFSRMFFVLVVFSILLSACVWNEEVRTDQAGVITDGGKILRCVGPGIHNEGGFYTDLRTMSTSTLTFGVEDPEVATKDNQLVGVAITIQARREADCDSITNLFTNWVNLLDDAQLQTTISATAREAIKIGVRSFSLTTLLDDRNGLSGAITDALTSDAGKYSTTIVNVTIENVALSPDYAAILQEKALVTAQIENAVRQQDLIRQNAANDQLAQEQRNAVLAAQLEAEKAETAIQLEIANRAGEVTAAENQVYIDNEAAFELEKLRILQNILGEGVIYFIPQGTDLTLFLTQVGSPEIIPVPSDPITPD